MIRPINNRELSWLSFNERVLMEALDTTNPLLERLKFLAIFSSNLDEFFMVRVSGLHEQVSAGYKEPDSSGMLPKEQLREITTRTRRLTDFQQKIFIRLKEELGKEQIFFPQDLSEFSGITESIFLNEIMPVISPVTIDLAHPFPFIYSRRFCMIVELERGGKSFISLIMVPETLKRVYRIKSSSAINIVNVEDIIKLYIDSLYKGYSVKCTGHFRVTRNADLDVREEEAADLLRAIEHSLSQRKKGNVNRVEINPDMSIKSLEFLKTMVDFTDDEIHFVDGTIDLTFLFSLDGIKPSLMFPPLKQHNPERLQGKKNLFDEIKERPVFLYRPYNSFSIVSELVRQASIDENVLAIKMTLYRTNRNSGIIASLLEAAKQGKQVSVVVELKARFDEERNIEWAKNLEEAGCLVTYGIVGLKIHAKCMLIVRKEGDSIVRYTHIATGNYNENTAKVYSDIDLITCEEGLGRDATKLFNYLMGFTYEDNWSRMYVAPFSLREKIIELIDNEINMANNAKSAHLIMKMNSFLDEDVIAKLYEASAAGVRIDLVVRGICGVKPGIVGLSDNIRVISIVGRFLEHSRVLYFLNGGTERYFITSADIMKRNLSGRVEAMVEIFDSDVKESLKNYLEISLKDNCKAWEMIDDKYTKRIPSSSVDRFNSQEYFLNKKDW